MFIIIYLFLVSLYQPSSSLIPLQEQTVSTIKIHVNPFFRLHSSNRTNESSSEIKQEQQNNPSTEIEQQQNNPSPEIKQQQKQHNSSLSSRSRSRSPPINRKVNKSSNKKRQERRNRAARREKFRKEKELIFKKQSSTKSKQHPSSPYRWEHKEEKLERLYKEYSSEDAFKEWKPLVLKDCFELYEYAFEKYYQTSKDD